MISRRRFNKERLLSGTLLETLILFLFILLAIASIYASKNQSLEEAIADGRILVDGQVPITESALEKLQNVKDEYEFLKNGSDSINQALVELQKIKQELEQEVYKEEKTSDSLQQRLDQGIMPPPCVLVDGNQTLLEIEFARDTLFLVKVININQSLILPNIILKKGEMRIFNKKDFDRLGRSLHESKRKNLNHPFCNLNNNPKAYSSAFCYECVYVAKIMNKIPSFEGIITKTEIPNSLYNYMTNRVHRYFSLLFEA